MKWIYCRIIAHMTIFGVENFGVMVWGGSSPEESLPMGSNSAFGGMEGSSSTIRQTIGYAMNSDTPVEVPR